MPMKFEVFVDDNFHYKGEGSLYPLRDCETMESNRPKIMIMIKESGINTDISIFKMFQDTVS